MRYFNSAQIFLLSILLQNTLASSLFARPPIPESIQLVYQFEKSWNNRGSVNRAIDTIVPIYHVDVPLDVVNLNRTNVPQHIQSQVIIEEQGRKFFRFFSTKKPPEDLRTYKGTPVRVGQVYYGFKLVSHATYLVWDPARPEPMRIKLTSDQDIRLKNWKKSTDMSRFIEQAGLRPGQGELFLTEPLAGQFLTSDSQFDLYNIHRAMDPSGRALSPQEAMVPLHAYLGSPYADKFTRVVPQFARLMANLQFKHGVYIEAHAQNFHVIVDKSTFEVVDFVFQDFYDVSIDPKVRILQGARGLIPDIRDMSIVDKLHVDPGVEADAASVVKTFLGQVISQPDDLAVFLKEFTATTEKLLGVRLPAITALEDYNKLYRAALKQLSQRYFEAKADAVPVSNRLLSFLATRPDYFIPATPSSQGNATPFAERRYFFDGQNIMVMAGQKVIGWYVGLNKQEATSLGLIRARRNRCANLDAATRQALTTMLRRRAG